MRLLLATGNPHKAEEIGEVLGEGYAVEARDTGADETGTTFEENALIKARALAQANQNWDTVTFNPVLGLFWFTAVVVCGVSSVRGAILAAVLYVAIPTVLDLDIQSAVGIFGVGAVLLGRLPGGAAAQLGRAGRALQAAVAEQYRHGRAPQPAAPAAPLPSTFAQAVLAERGRR